MTKQITETVGEESKAVDEPKVEFEYTNTNEMEELGSSNAYAEFMTIF